MPAIKYVICSCGEKISEQSEMTDKENELYQCIHECCGSIWVCKCGNRIIIRKEAPEAY